MYARCGRIDVAKKMFNEIGKRRNLCTWNSMITGLAVHGKCNKALELYEQMLREGTALDDVTFVGLVLACTHGGMVRKAEFLFKLEPWNPGNYVSSPIYMHQQEYGITKAAGYSLIEEGGDIHKFNVEDKTHPRCDEINVLLNEISSKMKLQRNLSDSGLELEELCSQ
ncbi:hypothetical protein Q3G72_033310 [Acer saccharum]|nr:hypothetical protein Q3G72_033310 [Acer saccharum]